MSPFIFVLIVLTAGVLAYRRQLRFLHVFQQEEYDNERFGEWISREHPFDRYATLILLISAFIRNDGFYTLVILALGTLAYTEPNPLQHARKTLNLTERAQRLLKLSLALSLAPSVLCALFLRDFTPLFLIASIQSLPFTLKWANTIFKEKQEIINQGFIDEAHYKLRTLNPKIIGITGSFGKTSTKHILHHILSTQVPSLTTPGSVNTPLGIARIVREQLLPSHQYFVAEMGAYGPGSIARLCDLAPPRIAAITAIGEAHYERFKNLETVAQSKFEIAQSVLRHPEGRLVLNIDSMESLHYVQDFVKAHRDRILLVGEHSQHSTLDYRIESVKQDENGLQFTLVDVKNQESFPVKAPIYGLAQAGNLAIAIVLAHLAGIPMTTSVSAVASTLQIPHRMQVMTLPNGTTLIDNAYNSNPKGFACSLDLLSTIAGSHRRRVLITPGMVELGVQHHTLHREIGELAARHVDVLLLINALRVPTFHQGFEEVMFGRAQRRSIPVETLKEAQEWLERNGTDSDVVLIENDLPDLYFKWTAR